MSMLDLLGLTRFFKGGIEAKPTRKLVNFEGPGVTVEDNPALQRTEIRIEGGGGGEGTVTGPSEGVGAGSVAVWADGSGTALTQGPMVDSLVTDEELATAISSVSGSAWETLLDLNLTQEANFSFADGAQTWKGLTWTGLHLASGSDFCKLVSGTGLVIDSNAVSTDWYLTINTAPRLYLPFSQIPGYQHGRTRVRIWTHQENTGADANYEQTRFGIETIPYASNARRVWGWALPQSGIPEINILDNAATSTKAVGASTYRVNMMEFDPALPQVQFFAKVPSAAAAAPNDAEFSLASMVYQGSWSGVVSGLNSNLDATRLWRGSDGSNIAFVMGAQTVNTSNTLVSIWKRLRIEYYHP